MRNQPLLRALSAAVLVAALAATYLAPRINHPATRVARSEVAISVPTTPSVTPSARPKPTPAPTTRPTPVPHRERPAAVPMRPPAPALVPGSVKARIAAAWPGNDAEAIEITGCETGRTWNPEIWDPSGTYYGLWQEDADFMRSYGSFVGASVEVQTAAAWKAYSSGRGYGPWPRCGRDVFGPN